MVQQETKNTIICNIDCGIYGFELPVVTPLTIEQVALLHEACQMKDSLKGEAFRTLIGDEAYDFFLHEIHPPFGVQIENIDQIIHDAEETLVAIERLKVMCGGNFPEALDRIATILAAIVD